MIDEYDKFGQSPILIPELFSNDFLVRGSTTGREPSEKHQHTYEKPVVSFSGMDTQVYLERTTIMRILRKGFDQATLDEMSTVIDGVIDMQTRQFPQTTAYELYSHIADALPFLGTLREPELKAAIQGDDLQAAAQAKEILLFTKLGSILKAVDQGVKYYPDLKDELAQAAVTAVLDHFPADFKQASQAVYLNSLHAVKNYIGLLEGVPARWVLEEQFINARDTLEAIAGQIWEEDGEIPEYYQFSEIAKEFGITKECVKEFLITRVCGMSRQEKRDTDMDVSIEQSLSQALSSLTERQRHVMVHRFGLDGGSPLTLNEIGKLLNRSREEIRRIEASALRHLRHPLRSRKLSGLRDCHYEAPVRGLKEESPPQGASPAELPERKRIPATDDSWKRWLEANPLPPGINMIEHRNRYFIQQRQQEIKKQKSREHWELFVQEHPLPDTLSDEQRLEAETQRYTEYKRWLKRTAV